MGGPQPEKALATLLLAEGQVVPLHALIDALWDGEPPPTATHQVHKVIANLRRKIAGAIETDGQGYRIRLENASFDVATFCALAAAPTIPNLTAALQLWRGLALAGIDSRALRARARVLDDRRFAVAETLVDLRLAAGQAAAVAVELPAMIAAHPLRETLRSRLMVALYRCGRQAEALSVYAETRALLADELGVEPGTELVRLHQQVLRADPALDAGPPAAPCTLFSL
jgi:DNA-binding SARP family transcriptional activator